jgi:nucleotide-binding universal stress UspA family protein
MPEGAPIVVGVDGSHCAEAAARWAAEEAALCDAELVIVYAASPVIGTSFAAPAPTDVLDWQHQQGRDILDQALQAARDVAGDTLSVSTREMSYAPVSALVQSSKSARMVVVGSRGMGKVARSLLGSVSMGLVHHAHCPVAVIRSFRSDEPGTPTTRRSPVLVGVDFSADSDLATELAFQEASRRKAPLVALHAWWSPGAFELAGPDWETIRPEVEQAFAARFGPWEQRFPGVDVRRIVVRDVPAEEIATRSQYVQLVVVGSRGYGAIASTLLGSVSAAVVQAVQAPVIVARS